MESFFECYARLLQPDCQRKKEEGDYYNSPLRYLGVPADIANQIDTFWMCRGVKKEDGIHEHLCLEDLSNKKRLNKSEEICKKHISNIFASEALLHIFTNTPDSLKSKFFEGADSYFGYTTNGYYVNDKALALLLDGLLAIIWAEYRKRKELCPKVNFIDDQYFHVMNISRQKMDGKSMVCLLYTSPSPRDRQKSRMPSSA